MGFPISFPEWEDAGTMPQQGSRNFVAGTKPKAKHFDALMTAIFSDHEMFAELLEKYGAAEFFPFDAMITLAETGTGQAPGTAVVGVWPAWEFGPDEPDDGMVEEVYVFPRLAADSGAIWLLWSTPDGDGKKVVWKAEVYAIGVGGDLTSAGSIVSVTATPVTQADVLNRTILEFGPLAGADQFLAIRIYRDAESVDDEDGYARLHSVGVMVA